MCKIQTVDNGQAHGALYQVIDNNRRDRYLIMTSHHVLPTSSLNCIIRTKFSFQEIQQMASITLKWNQVKYVWTDKFLDATVIEIFSDLAALYRSYGAQFLQVKEAKDDVKVVILKYSSETFISMMAISKLLKDLKYFIRLERKSEVAILLYLI